MNKQIQVGLRLNETRNAYLEMRANEIGVSKNALIQMLIELGIKILDGELVIPAQTKE